MGFVFECLLNCYSLFLSKIRGANGGVEENSVQIRTSESNVCAGAVKHEEDALWCRDPKSEASMINLI